MNDYFSYVNCTGRVGMWEHLLHIEAVELNKIVLKNHAETRIFFKKMSEMERENWEKGCVVGFFVLLIALLANQMYFYIFNGYLLSSFSVFWIGLVSAFVWDLILKAVKRNIN